MSTTPTGRGLDAALSRLMGWAKVRAHMVANWSGIHPGEEWARPVPHYSSSLDAMAGVEAEIGRRGLMGWYGRKVLEIISGVIGVDSSADPIYPMGAYNLGRLITAPAAVRAAAAYAVLSEGVK